MYDVSSTKNIAHAVMEMGAAARVQDYLARGRKHEALDTTALHELHLATFREFARDPAPGAARNAHDDCEAEYAIRGLEADFSELGLRLDAVAKAAKEMLARMTPEQLDEMEDGIQRDYEAHVRKRN